MADEAAATIRQLSERNHAVLRIGGDEAAADALLPTLSIFLTKQPYVSIEFRRMCAATDSAPPTGRFVIMPGVDCLNQAVVNGLGIGIVPRAAVSSRTAHAGLVVIPLSPARAASALTVVYRGNHGRPTAGRGFHRGRAQHGRGPHLEKSTTRHEDPEVSLSDVHGVATTPLIPDTIGASVNRAVCAWLRLRDGFAATEEECRDFCRRQIATFKIPRYIRFTSESPMTVTGKLQKFRMPQITWRS
jgi:LysR substrate binding domain/AMP-binding enzyme C-terminal domain